ncbi:hypothetical protein NLI96_g11059 [Meripilus lineatus]|uniref:Aminoglycoside phosphotransferase domain-containing protein n=1 Tax=Meripilus lineatus TaxID=2056292 RepID=A0AAD5UUV8_9APHY|nr:hypothetical protein NLI96_g11059 [Physisporinus lineatus]
MSSPLLKPETRDLNRGPYQSTGEVLTTAAHKEIAYLKKFGQPLLPFRREKRPSYKYQLQSPSDYIDNLQRYLSITSSLIPGDSALSRFCIRHPDLHPDNIFVSRSPDSGCKIVSLFDWQHTSILPMFILAGIPQRLQNHGDGISESMTLPPRPENLGEMSEAQRANEEYKYSRRLIHYHYVTSTKECNQLHYAAFTDPLYALRGRLYLYGGSPWEGETSELKTVLIEAAKRWEGITGGGVPCPLKFDAEELREMAELDRSLSRTCRGFGILESMCGIGEEGWVLPGDYQKAVAFMKQLQKDWLAGAQSAQERDEITNHWPWDDMDEEMYL